MHNLFQTGHHAGHYVRHHIWHRAGFSPLIAGQHRWSARAEDPTILA
jgi:hypothetical protein